MIVSSLNSRWWEYKAIIHKVSAINNACAFTGIGAPTLSLSQLSLKKINTKFEYTCISLKQEQTEAYGVKHHKGMN